MNFNPTDSRERNRRLYEPIFPRQTVMVKNFIHAPKTGVAQKGGCPIFGDVWSLARDAGKKDRAPPRWALQSLGGRITVPPASLPRSIDSHEGMGTKVPHKSRHQGDKSLAAN